MNAREVELRIGADVAKPLFRHLFPGDGDEHGAIIAAGVVDSPRGLRLLARDLFLAEDGRDYVPGQFGYRALSPRFIAEAAGYCGDHRLAYIAVHCHAGTDRVGLSTIDVASQERGYPALLQITRGGPVAGVVFATDAAAGDVWLDEAHRLPLTKATTIGPIIRSFYPSPRLRPVSRDPRFDRHARMFGDIGQGILTSLKVGIIGLGGAGSLLNEWLSRLGIGHIVAIDFDTIDDTNLPRVVGATAGDAADRVPKVTVAARVAREANPQIQYDAIEGNLIDEPVARHLVDCDFLFLAADSMQARLVVTALVHQYLIPGSQVGVKVPVIAGKVSDPFTVTRTMLPTPNGGCLVCSGLVPPGRLQEEVLSPQERAAQRYVESDEVHAPAVITLNALATAQAANDLVMLFTGLYREDATLPFLMNFVAEREIKEVAKQRVGCSFCGTSVQSARARGDRADLPCRESQSSEQTTGESTPGLPIGRDRR